MDEIYYKKNFLNEVIARVDFLSPLLQIKDEIPKAISDVVLNIFPIAEPQDVIGSKLQIDGKGIKTDKTEDYREWQFHDKKRTKTLKISIKAAIVSYSRYASYENLTSEFFTILDAFFKKYNEAQISRIGLRYINHIKIEGPDPLEWSEYLNDKIISLFKFSNDKTALLRVFHNLEYSYDDYRIRYQFGMHNPDYPTPIKQKLFVLDIDAFTNYVTDHSQLKTVLDVFHLRIQTIFESSIKDKLRKLMND